MLTEAGTSRYDACGECLGWGYGGSTCAGCDGVPNSRLLVDACGVCGGSCSCLSVCSNSSATCTLEQTSGPGVGGRFSYTPPAGVLSSELPTCYFVGPTNTSTPVRTLCPRDDLAAPAYQVRSTSSGV